MFLFVNAVGLVNSLEHFFVEVAIPMGWEEGIARIPLYKANQQAVIFLVRLSGAR